VRARGEEIGAFVVWEERGGREVKGEDDGGGDMLRRVA
jgi:hypothetical protein